MDMADLDYEAIEAPLIYHTLQHCYMLYYPKDKEGSDYEAIEAHLNYHTLQDCYMPCRPKDMADLGSVAI
jgi:hypothetical protein